MPSPAVAPDSVTRNWSRWSCWPLPQHAMSTTNASIAKPKLETVDEAEGAESDGRPNVSNLGLCPKDLVRHACCDRSLAAHKCEANRGMTAAPSLVPPIPAHADAREAHSRRHDGHRAVRFPLLGSQPSRACCHGRANGCLRT